MAMTAAEKAVQDGRQARIEHLETENKDLQGSLTQATRLNESLRKELEGTRLENVALRENMQRALGYIDRVNENDEPLDPVPVPQSFHHRQRGPQLSPIGANYLGADSSDYGMTKQRRY